MIEVMHAERGEGGYASGVTLRQAVLQFYVERDLGILDAVDREGLYGHLVTESETETRIGGWRAVYA